MIAIALCALSACGSSGPVHTPQSQATTGTSVAESVHLRAFDAATGTQRWSVPLALLGEAHVAAAGGFVFVNGTAKCELPYGTLVAVDGASGHVLWRTDIDPATDLMADWGTPSIGA